MRQSPPDVLRVDEKFVAAYYVPNIVGLVITTNHENDGIYLPSDDRRFYVAWSNSTKEEFVRISSKVYGIGWSTRAARAMSPPIWRNATCRNSTRRARPIHTPAFFDIVDAGQSAGRRRTGRCARSARTARHLFDRDDRCDHDRRGP